MDPILKGQLKSVKARYLANAEITAKRLLEDVDQCNKTASGCRSLIKKLDDPPEGLNRDKILRSLAVSTSRLAEMQAKTSSIIASLITESDNPMDALGDMLGGLGGKK